MLSAAAIASFEEDGFYFPVPVLTVDEAAEVRALVEWFERRHPEAIGKRDLKANLLFPLLDRISRHAKITDAFASVMGPDILCQGVIFRNKAADGKTYVSWHQDTTYQHIRPIMVSCWTAITEATVENGCMRIIPGSHKWPQLPHTDSVNADNMLSRGHTIDADFDQSRAVDVELGVGEGLLIHYGVAHSSPPNTSSDRRMAMLVDCFPASAVKDGPRESAMLVAGADPYGHFDHDVPPQEDYGPAEVARHRAAVEAFTRGFYSGWDRVPEAISGHARNAV